MTCPKLHPGLLVGNPASGVQAEFFLDFACPYSRKMFDALLPLLEQGGGGVTDGLACVLHNVIQPWHHQSLWLHEAAFAVRQLFPAVEFAFWKALFRDAPAWYDKEIYGLTRAQFYTKISALAAEVVVQEIPSSAPVAAVQTKLLQYLVPPKQEGGNYPEEARHLGSGPEDDENALFPYTLQTVKFHRKRGVHTTPTVFMNGMEQAQITSAWTADQLKDFLAPMAAKVQM